MRTKIYMRILKKVFTAVIICFISFPASASPIRWDLSLVANSGAPNGAFGLSVLPPEFFGFVTFDLTGGSGGAIVDFGLTIGDTTWDFVDLNQLGGDSTLDSVGLSLIDNLGTSPVGRNLVVFRLSDGSISEWSARDNRGLDETISGVFDVKVSSVSEPDTIFLMVLGITGIALLRQNFLCRLILINGRKPYMKARRMCDVLCLRA